MNKNLYLESIISSQYEKPHFNIGIFSHNTWWKEKHRKYEGQKAEHSISPELESVGL